MNGGMSVNVIINCTYLIIVCFKIKINKVFKIKIKDMDPFFPYIVYHVLNSSKHGGEGALSCFTFTKNILRQLIPEIS